MATFLKRSSPFLYQFNTDFYLIKEAYSKKEYASFMTYFL